MSSKLPVFLKKHPLFVITVAAATLASLYLGFAFDSSIKTASADEFCSVYSVSAPLTDLGGSEYYRLVSTNPLTYEPTGIIGGLYPDGMNVRPASHEVAGVALASEVMPRNASGAPDGNGKIGMISIGMSNTQTEFGRFIQSAQNDPDINDKLVIVNGASSGSVIDRWIDPTHPNYQMVWENVDHQISRSGLTDEQVQVAWVKVTQQSYQSNFPEDMQALSVMYEELATMLKSKFPNLKITYFSSRTRSFSYHMGLSPEPTAFENAFAVRWLIERQLNGDPNLNYDSDIGPDPVSYLSWGPYLWIDGHNPRSDGRVWPNTFTTFDCTHPAEEGANLVAEMLMEFFKSDTTATPWFLDSGITPPPPPPLDTTAPVISSITTSNIGENTATISWTTDEASDTQVEFVGACPSAGCLTQLNPSLTTIHTANVSGLSSGTEYFFLARSADASGNLTTSSIHSFITDVPPPPPQEDPAESGFIIDHTNLHLFEEIPEQYLTAAANLNMMFADRSVGSNINDGLTCLGYASDEAAPNHCKRITHVANHPEFNSPASEVNWSRVGGYNRSNWDFYGIEGNIPPVLPCGGISTGQWYGTIECFIYYVDNNPEAYDVYSYEVSYLSVDGTTDIASDTKGYFVDQDNRYDIYDLADLEARHPSKTFLYWTTSLSRGIGTPDSTDFNEDMRAYAAANSKILLDVADIISHDPSGNPCYDNRDGVAYNNGNRIENHPDDGVEYPAICPHYTTELDGGHFGSTSAGKIRVAKGFWIAMAYIAGWRPDVEPPPPPPLDTTAPVISSITTSNIGENTATISWTTDEASDTQVEFVGACPSAGCLTQLNSSLTTIHTANVSGLSSGTEYFFLARSADASGNLATSSLHSFVTEVPPPPPPPDTEAPAVFVSSPLNGSVVSGQVSIEASATDNVGVAGVQFVLSGTNFGAEDVSAPYSMAWDTTGINNGLYELAAVARDSAGNISTSPAVTVEVNNPPQGETGLPISSWGFATDNVTDDVNGCTGCFNSGAVWTSAGVVPGAFDFSGNSYLNLGLFPYLNNSTSFTLSTWIRPDFSNLSPNRHYVISNGAINLFYMGNSKWRALLRTASNTIRLDSPTLSWSAGEWHQITITFDNSSAKMYWDGTLVSTQPTSAPMFGNTGATSLGRSMVGTDGFDGLIDELKIYDYSMTALEAAQSFNRASQ